MSYTAGAYIADVVVRPKLVANRARQAADARGKPLLNVGCGTSDSSLRVFLLGPTGWGDINCDLASSSSCNSAGCSICKCNILNLGWPDKTFGAAIASHILEHVADPIQALAELHRVADEVFIITPPWWAPHTWLHPGHRWWVTPAGEFKPLWGSEK